MEGNQVEENVLQIEAVALVNARVRITVIDR